MTRQFNYLTSGGSTMLTYPCLFHYKISGRIGLPIYYIFTVKYRVLPIELKWYLHRLLFSYCENIKSFIFSHKIINKQLWHHVIYCTKCPRFERNTSKTKESAIWWFWHWLWNLSHLWDRSFSFFYSCFTLSIFHLRGRLMECLKALIFSEWW